MPFIISFTAAQRVCVHTSWQVQVKYNGAQLSVQADPEGITFDAVAGATLVLE